MSPKLEDRLAPAAWATVAAVAVGLGIELWGIAASSARLPLWDMAKYGLSALRLHDAALALDLPRLLAELNGLSVWPPLWPSVTAVAFAVLGVDFATPRLLTVGAWVASVVAAAWAPRPLPGGAAVGVCAAAWLASGPMFQALSTVHLLEVPGLLLLILCLGCYLRALAASSASETKGLGWWRATATATLCLFFCKYNYGLLWIVPLGLHEARRRTGSWGELGRRTMRGLGRVPWKHPVTLFFVGGFLLLLGIRLTGGFEWTIAGRSVSLTSIGNPAYFLYLAACAWALHRRRVGLGAIPWIGEPRPEDRVFLRRLVAPVAVWMLIPPHVKDLFGFLENRVSELSWVDAATFYPAAFVELYAPRPWLGILVAIAAVLGLRDLWGPSDGRRILALCLGVGALALAAHPYKLDRFAFQVAWLAGLVAAASVIRPRTARGRLVALALSIGVLVATARAGVDRDFVEERHRLWTVPETSLPLLEDLADVERRRDGGVLVLGAWNGLSPALIETVARMGDHRAGTEAPWPRGGLDVARGRSDRLLGVLDRGEFRWVAVVSRASGRPAPAGFEEETAWLASALERLERSSLYEPVGSSSRVGSYGVRWYRRVPAVPVR